MRCDPGEESAGRLLAKLEPGQRTRRGERGQPEARQGEWVARKMEHRLQKFRAQFFPVAHEGLQQPAPGAGVFA